MVEKEEAEVKVRAVIEKELVTETEIDTVTELVIERRIDIVVEETDLDHVLGLQYQLMN